MPATVVLGPTPQPNSAGAYVYSYEGPLRPVTGESRLYIDEPSVVRRIRASVKDAPDGQPVIVGVNLNGSLAETIEIPVGEHTAFIEPDENLVDPEDYLTIDILQVGLGQNPGVTLTVQIQINGYEGV